jgi:peptidoglycan hydrolase CwlO-like protein
MLFSARIRELEGQVESLTAHNQELVTANAQCATRYEADQSRISELTTARDLAISERDALAIERDAAVAAKNDSDAALAAEREGRETAIRTQVDQRLADAGAAPIQRDPAATAKTEAKPEASGLTGREKAVAAINAQLSK